MALNKAIFIVIFIIVESNFAQVKENTMTQEKEKRTEKEWQETLTPEQYRILREKGTERAFTGKYDKYFEKGTYTCAGCSTPLFESETKYDSGCGWPAFYQSLPEAIDETPDHSFGRVRTEITCSKCDGHLGHVFTDGPKPTGLRYCVNSVSLDFISPDNKENSE
jgi:peptide-methionine (R)-S-oxide reductase